MVRLNRRQPMGQDAPYTHSMKHATHLDEILGIVRDLVPDLLRKRHLTDNIEAPNNRFSTKTGKNRES